MKLDEVVKAFDKNVDGVSLVKEIVNVKSNEILNTFRSHDLAGNKVKLVLIVSRPGFLTNSKGIGA